MSKPTVSSVAAGGSSNRETSKVINEILNNIKLCNQQGIQNPTVIVERIPFRVLSIGMNYKLTRQASKSYDDIAQNVLLEIREGINNPEVRMTRLD